VQGVSQPEQLGALVDVSIKATVQLGDQPIKVAQLHFSPGQRYPPMTRISRAMDERLTLADVGQQQPTLGFEFGSEVSRLLDVGALCRLNVKVRHSHRGNVTDLAESCHLGNMNSWTAYEINWAAYESTHFRRCFSSRRLTFFHQHQREANRCLGSTLIWDRLHAARQRPSYRRKRPALSRAPKPCTCRRALQARCNQHWRRRYSQRLPRWFQSTAGRPRPCDAYPCAAHWKYSYPLLPLWRGFSADTTTS
jgi:hypothetical protein